MFAGPPNFDPTKRLNLSSPLKSWPSDVPVKMPTEDITACRLRPYGQQAVRDKDCTRNVTAYGEPPYLKLNLSLVRLAATEAGVWELQVSNDYGTGSLLISVSSNDYEESPTDAEPKIPLAWAIPLATGGGFLVLAALIVGIVRCGFRKQQTLDKTTNTEELSAPSRNNQPRGKSYARGDHATDDSVKGSHSNSLVDHTYEEVSPDSCNVQGNIPTVMDSSISSGDSFAGDAKLKYLLVSNESSLALGKSPANDSQTSTASASVTGSQYAEPISPFLPNDYLHPVTSLCEMVNSGALAKSSVWDHKET